MHDFKEKSKVQSLKTLQIHIIDEVLKKQKAMNRLNVDQQKLVSMSLCDMCEAYIFFSFFGFFCILHGSRYLFYFVA